MDARNLNNILCPLLGKITRAAERRRHHFLKLQSSKKLSERPQCDNHPELYVLNRHSATFVHKMNQDKLYKTQIYVVYV